MTNARSTLANAREREILALHAAPMSKRKIADEIKVSPGTVRRHLPRAKAMDAQPANGASRAIVQDADVREQRRCRQRALDVERGLFWLTVFGVLPNTESWNATKARAKGATSFFCHEFPFFSRLDGRWHPWASPQRIARDFRSEDLRDRGLDAFGRVVARTAAALELQGTPYAPLAFRESVFSAAIAAGSRLSMADPTMSPPPAVLCRSLREDTTGWENPARFGMSPWGPFGLPRVEERGLVVIASRDAERRFDSARKAVLADLVDDGVGVAITSTPSGVTIASRVGPIPALERFVACGGQMGTGARVTIPERASGNEPMANGARNQGARTALLAGLRWALNCGPELTAAGHLSLVVAEAQANGNTVLPELAGFLDLWSVRHAPPDPAALATVLDLAASGDLGCAETELAALTSSLLESRLAVVAIIEPSNDDDESCLVSKATYTFEFTSDDGIDRSAILDPGHGISAAHLTAIRRALETA